jgi:hypothetical protein
VSHLLLLFTTVTCNYSRIYNSVLQKFTEKRSKEGDMHGSKIAVYSDCDPEGYGKATSYRYHASRGGLMFIDSINLILQNSVTTGVVLPQCNYDGHRLFIMHLRHTARASCVVRSSSPAPVLCVTFHFQSPMQTAEHKTYSECSKCHCLMGPASLHLCPRFYKRHHQYSRTVEVKCRVLACPRLPGTHNLFIICTSANKF